MIKNDKFKTNYTNDIIYVVH